MNRIALEKRGGVTMCPKIVKQENTLKFSNECLCAQKIVELLTLGKDPKRNFMTICDIHEIVEENDLNGMDIFLHLENMLGRDKVFTGNELTSLVNEMFLEYSSPKTNAILNSFRIGKYNAWRLAIDSIYCIQPIFFHYVNEKEFVFNWSCKTKEWIRQY